MTDVKTKITDFAAKEDKAAKAWFGSNWVPVAVGILIGLAIDWVIHRL